MIYDLSIPKLILNSGITKEDVWGTYDDEFKLVSKGMIIASAGELCPVNKEVLPSKSVVITCNKEQSNAVFYWLEYVLGANSIRRIIENQDNTIIVRADYMCW